MTNQIETSQSVYRTSASRTGRMMIIMLGICIAGGTIFFAMWDYWISEPAPIVAILAGDTEIDTADQTGKTITSTLAFVESDDFRILGFNALPGEEGSNPTIKMNVGDKLDFEIINNGMYPHSFGVTKNEEGFAGIIPDSEVGTASNGLKSGAKGLSEFVAGEEGTFYYICTIPGHRLLGMVGEIIVETAVTVEDVEASAPTGISHEFDLEFIEADDYSSLAFNALPGEEGHNPDIVVNSGDEVTINVSFNKGVSLHAFGIVSNPKNLNSIVMDSAIPSTNSQLNVGDTGSSTFIAGKPGTYYYICTISGHAIQGMQGKFIVE